MAGFTQPSGEFGLGSLESRPVLKETQMPPAARWVLRMCEVSRTESSAVEASVLVEMVCAAAATATEYHGSR